MPSPKAAMRTMLVTAALIFGSGINAAPGGLQSSIETGPVDPRVQPQIVALIEQRRRNPRFGMRRKEAMAIFGIGLTRMMTLEADGEVVTYLDSVNRMITVDSVYIRQIALLLLAFPSDGRTPKARLPAQRYQPRPRLRTQAELEGLRRGNEQRTAAARQRKEAKQAVSV
jgi:hypothetical protein